MILEYTSSTDCLVLAIDSASPIPSIALRDQSGPLASLYLKGPLAHVEHLMPEIEALLKRVDKQLSDLDVLAAVTGPGSFTGIRVGLAAIQGLASVFDLPVVGVSSLKATCLKLPYAAHPVCALADLRRAKVYSGVYDTSAGGAQLLQEEGHRLVDDIVASISAPTLFVGDGALALYVPLKKALGELALFAPASVSEGLAGVVADFAHGAAQNNQTIAADGLIPHYIGQFGNLTI